MNKNIYKELKEIAPNLSEIGKQNPYKVPEGYFESFDMESIIKNDKNSDLPEGYFDTLPDIIIDKIKASDIKPAKRSIIKELKPYTMGIAASFGLLIMSVVILNNNKSIDSMSETNEELIAYIELHNDEFEIDLYEIMDEDMVFVELGLNEISNEDLNLYYDLIDDDDMEDLFE